MITALKQRIRPYIATRDFYIDALKVMIPVSIQHLITTMFNAIDNLMVGMLDVNGLAMSAITVANRPYNIFACLMFGMTGAGGLMISQYYGAKDGRSCQGLFALQAMLALAMSALFGGLLALFPESIMRIFINDPQTVELGVSYLRVIWFSYLPMAFTSASTFSLRAIGQNKISMYVSIMAMAMNALCNYALIFGHFGFPAMGVVGAAWGTLIARVVEMLIYVVILLRHSTPFTMDLSAFRHLSRPQLRTYTQKAFPLVFNEVLYSAGVTTFFWAYSRLNEAALPALTIGEQISNIAAVLAVGTSSAVAVMIGTKLGANQLAEAKSSAKKLLALVCATGAGCMLLCFLLGLFLPRVFSVTPELQAQATLLSFILGALSPLSFIYSFCFNVMRAGGDTRNAMLLDSGYLWVIPVPVALLMGLLLPGKMTLVPAVLIISFLMNIKVIWALWVVKKGRWVRNITIE